MNRKIRDAERNKGMIVFTLITGKTITLLPEECSASVGEDFDNYCYSLERQKTIAVRKKSGVEVLNARNIVSISHVFDEEQENKPQSIEGQ